MTKFVPLTSLPKLLLDRGCRPASYRTLYEMVLSAKIPAVQNKAGRWEFAESDLDKIANIVGKPKEIQATAQITALNYKGETLTVSYNLPVELIELYRDLAEERLKVDRAQKREARRKGEKPPQARRSASALVREAMEAYRPKIEAELKALRE